MKRKILMTIILIMVVSVIIFIPYIVNAAQYVQYVRSGISAFPEDYQSKLKEIAKQYPNWKFQAYYTGISWNELMQKERDEGVHRNRVHVNSDSSWKHDCNFAEGSYACASDSIVAYYLDTRNFLNEKNIFQFVESSYNESQQTVAVVEKSLKGTFLDSKVTYQSDNGTYVTKSYAEIIVDAAKQSNISAFYIKSKIIQEVGSQGSNSVSGKYPGYEGYYNFFNYGASDSGNPIANGLQFAKNQGWNNQYKAIVGGAKLIGKQYIEAGQNTAYFNKWDVVGTSILKDGQSQVVQEKDMFWHQYMTNIEDPTSQSYSNYNLYKDSFSSEITFIIPVYNNMPASNPKPQDIKLQSISLHTTQLNLQVGAEATIKTGYIGASYNPSNATDKVLYWSSSNNNVATVLEGNIKAVGEGTATITARSRDGGKTATCQVTVTKIDKALQSIKASTEKISLKVGETGWIGVTYSPSNASDKVLYWNSSDTNVATILEGNIKALKRGTATLTATSRDGNKKATCQVTVTDPNYIELQSIQMNESKKKLKVGETGWIGVTYNPSNATNKVLSWTSSNEKVATISEGTIKAVGAGTTILTAKTNDGGKTATCELTVNANDFIDLESIIINKTAMTLKEGENAWLGVTYKPSNATEKTLYWTSSDNNIVTVKEGNVKAIKKGTAILTATAKDGGKTATCQVTVTDGIINLESLQLQTTKLEIKQGEGANIYATYNPSNVTDKVLYWKSNNTSVATVTDGYVKAMGNGIATITATSRDGGKTATCQITVTDGNVHLQSLSLQKNNMTMKKGDKATIYATYNPSNVTDKVLYWKSSNTNVATVSEGNIMALGNGTTTITATARDGGKTANCQVTVEGTEVSLQSLSLKNSVETVKKGNGITIYATYNPSNVTDKVLYWTSNNASVATVTDGYVKTIGNGIATITATSRDGGKKATCQIIVVNPNTNISSIALQTDQKTMKKGEKTTIYATYNPTNVVDKVLYWISSNTSVATVSEGSITAIGKGTTTITAITRDGGKKATCTITVE